MPNHTDEDLNGKDILEKVRRWIITLTPPIVAISGVVTAIVQRWPATG